MVVFATVNVDLGVGDTPWATRAHAHDDVFEYRGAFYTGQRRHSPARLPAPAGLRAPVGGDAGHALDPVPPHWGPAPSRREPHRASRSDADEGGRYLGIPPITLARAHHPTS